MSKLGKNWQLQIYTKIGRTIKEYNKMEKYISFKRMEY